MYKDFFFFHLFTFLKKKKIELKNELYIYIYMCVEEISLNQRKSTSARYGGTPSIYIEQPLAYLACLAKL